MRFRPAFVLLAVDLSVALFLALGYGLRYGTCAPPDVLCTLPGFACFAMCGDAWAQFPQVMLFGLVIGLLPGSASFLTATGIHAEVDRGVAILIPRLAAVCGSASAVLLAVAGLSFFLIDRTTFFVPVASGFAAGMVLLLLSAIWAFRQRGSTS
jgi:hypothetical protein